MVAGVVTLQDGIGIVAAGAGHLGPVARLAAKRKSIREVGERLVQVAHRLGQEAEETIVAD